ncbi:uncharacterized protein LOC144576739 isoform X2 [Callithrix jacchus]
MTASPRSPSAAAEPPPRTATRNRGESRGHLCLGGRVRGPSQLRLRHPWLLATATGARRARPWNKGSVAPAAWWGCRAPRCRSPVAAARDEDGQPWSRSGRAGPSFCVASTGPTQLPTSIRPTSPASQSHPLTPGPLWQQSGPSGTLTAAGHAAKQATAPEAPEGAILEPQKGTMQPLSDPQMPRGPVCPVNANQAETHTELRLGQIPEQTPGCHWKEPDTRDGPLKIFGPKRTASRKRNRSRYTRAHSVTHRSNGTGPGTPVLTASLTGAREGT